MAERAAGICARCGAVHDLVPCDEIFGEMRNRLRAAQVAEAADGWNLRSSTLAMIGHELSPCPMLPQRGYLDLAQAELARVSEISSHTLTFNRQRDVKGEASMSALLDSVGTLYQGRIAASGISVERRYRDGRSLICRPGELRQVFVNLISNAFDATRTGGRIVLRERATTDSRTGKPGVLITVADTGHGVEAQLKANLFEAFRSTKGINGSGLGLWISKGIVEKHRGSMRFRSSTKPGSRGTVFQVFIPYEGSPTIQAHTAPSAV